jgi:hypothetical protein
MSHWGGFGSPSAFIILPSAFAPVWLPPAPNHVSRSSARANQLTGGEKPANVLALPVAAAA